MWKCLIIEDDRDNAQYIANGFRELGHHAAICYDGVEGLRRATSEQWDVIILDRMLPNQIDGLAILTTLRSLGKKVPVLVLSALTSLDERVRGLKSGGDDYLVKPFALMELLARTEALVRRSQNDKADRLIEYADLRMDLAVPRVTRGGKEISLQPREYRLLSYMMMHCEQTLTRAMLLGSVWGYQFNPQTNVIDAAISRLRQKIDGAHAPPWLIHTVRGAGYMLAERDQPSGNTRAEP